MMELDPLRRTGRTHRMIMSLPATGSIVVAPTEELANCLRDTTRQLRGDAVTGATHFVGQAREGQIALARQLPVFRDHSCQTCGPVSQREIGA